MSGRMDVADDLGIRPRIIGITGPIGCGKSTVLGWLAVLDGVTAIDADETAREVLAPGTLEVEAVYVRFGSTLRRRDGTLDRGALGRIVFADAAALRELEAIVHPAVRGRILAAITAADARGDRAVVIEAIKLVEGGLADLCDEVWLVTCDQATQLERLVGRGVTIDDARARMAIQAGLDTRVRSSAGLVRMIVTDGDPRTTRTTVLAAFDEALQE